MKPDPESVRKILLNAQQAMQHGNRKAARRWAEQAVALDPYSEGPWLFLAALASPRASVNYLEQALKINPDSQRARKGMQWAVERLRQEQEEQSSKRKSALAESTKQPQAKRLPAQTVARSDTPEVTLLPNSLVRNHWSFLTLFLVILCLIAAWVFWPGNAAPVLAFLHAPRSISAIPGILADVIKPIYTPSPTDTFTPTATITATLTFTPTSTPSDTPTLTPTDTPTATETFTPTDTPKPTDTEIPGKTSTPGPIPEPIGGSGVRWIDVSLSKQTLYAYEGNTIVASFLVSTGVRQFPTVTGQYHIYIKLLSTLMHGDGYYLPNVPYTMYFYKSYGIHGTYWHHNFGHPMSHGCVNMYTPDAKWLYNWASVGTLVNIHY
ncbi:MAG: L,D-transpeptidase family protein [Anaerolineales bacterium]|jgi:lipoprotein-anchoring transpeptidase ErfK/SrfK